MDSILSWASTLDKRDRSKASKQVQQQLFLRIDSALATGIADEEDAVAALCKFDAKVIEPFYTQHYSTYAPEVRDRWDRAMMQWACTNRGKQVHRATIRLAPTLMAKLPAIDTVAEVVPELQWLAANDLKRAAEALKQLRNRVDEADLRKLLDLDMRDWTDGQEAMEEFYRLLFGDSADLETREVYAAFLARHGAEAAAATPDSAAEEALAVEAAAAPSAPEPAAVSLEGVAMAEALVQWAREQCETVRAQAARIASLEAELAAAKGNPGPRPSPVAGAEDPIEQMKRMHRNNLRQEMEGFKYELATDLAHIVRYFHEEYEEAEKAEIYAALLEETIASLKRFGVPVEEV